MYVVLAVEIWTLPTTNTTYTRSQNYTNMIIGKHEIQTYSVGYTILLFTISVEQDKHNW